MSTLSDDEVSKILANRQAARLRHDYKTADRLRDQLNEQCVSVDDKKNRWDAADGRCGQIEPFTCTHPGLSATDCRGRRAAGVGASAEKCRPDQSLCSTTPLLAGNIVMPGPPQDRVAKAGSDHSSGPECSKKTTT